MDARPAAVSPLYLLERFEAGIVQLDAERRVVAMNDFARKVLPVADKQPFDRFVLSFHPERSQSKVEFMLDQAACPVANPPPMTMIINIPERVLLIKVTRLSDGERRPAGYTLVFYDITELVAGEDAAAAPRGGTRRRLLKIPTVARNRIVLVDAGEVLAIQSDGHYTHVHTEAGPQFCNLAIGDLEARLDPERFVRVHRSHIVNPDAVQQLLREDGRLAVRLGAGDLTVPVSRTSAAALLARLGVQV